MPHQSLIVREKIKVLGIQGFDLHEFHCYLYMCGPDAHNTSEASRERYHSMDDQCVVRGGDLFENGREMKFAVISRAALGISRLNKNIISEGYPRYIVADSVGELVTMYLVKPKT
ncbi:hypothetical protein AVEN_148271-1 [Araneus ventricosus]|uniref:Uncharacterized protein n=1 Tax=Araneus ventricosus TaxID=182803 RepID=A0A4Y2HJW3_ARAVE|nr:hypothetical protein AVEN_148271-1 [Araneus ventricosus]